MGRFTIGSGRLYIRDSEGRDVECASVKDMTVHFDSVPEGGYVQLDYPYAPSLFSGILSNMTIYPYRRDDLDFSIGPVPRGRKALMSSTGIRPREVDP